MNRQDLLKIAKPILFNMSMVQAIQNDRKTSTRRVIKFPEGTTGRLPFSGARDYIYYPGGIKRARYKVGDILYVRETWCQTTAVEPDYGELYHYKAAPDCIIEQIPKEYLKWKPSIHMPKKAARIFLKVTDVRIERLQDIAREEAINEGFQNEDDWGAEVYFEEFWDSTIKKKDIDIYGWNANPWVWAIEFEKLEVE